MAAVAPPRGAILNTVVGNIVDLMPMPACVGESVSGRLTRFNRGFEALFDRTPGPGETLAGFLGRFRWEVSGLPGDSFDATPIARAAASGTVLREVDLAVETAGGVRREVRASLWPLREDGAPGFLCVFNDLTETRNLRSALRGYARMLDQIHDAVIATDVHSRVTFWSKGAERVYGYSAEEAIGRHVSFLYLPEDLDMLQRDVLGPLFSKGEHALEKRVRRKSGDVIFVELALALLRDPTGAVTGVVGYSTDVTERRRAVEALRASEERLRLALTAGKMRAWDWDATTDAVVWSGATSELLGYRSGSGTDFLGCVHPDDRATVTAAMTAALTRDCPFELQYRLVFDDGSVHWIDATAGAQRDSTGRPTRLVGVARDVTSRKRAEGEREELLAMSERAREEAEAASRGKDEFLAMLGHELRNPLGAARNAVIVAQFDGGQRESALDIARRQMDQLSRLVDDLLDVARITQGTIQLQKKPLGLEAVVRSALDSVRSSLEDQGHALRVSLPPDDIRLEADQTRLEQVLVNLLGNAVKYTPPGGQIQIAVARAGDEGVITVSDNGVGIAPGMLPRVFDLFAQSPQAPDRTRGGLGIGLTIVRRLVALHGGSVEAHSEGSGRGAKFTVRLPALPPAGAADRPRVAAPGEAPRLRILVVEDNVEAAESLRMLLGTFGQDVRVVYHGVAALEAVRCEVPDIVLLDIGLPGMDGYEVARHLRSRPESSAVTLVAVTGYGRAEDRARALAAGFDEHLTKPLDVDRLEALLGDVASHRAAPGKVRSPDRRPRRPASGSRAVKIGRPRGQVRRTKRTQRRD